MWIPNYPNNANKVIVAYIFGPDTFQCTALIRIHLSVSPGGSHHSAGNFIWPSITVSP